MNNYKITVPNIIKIHKSPKKFCLFNVKDNAMTNIKLTNDIKRYHKQYDDMYTTARLKEQINSKLTIY